MIVEQSLVVITLVQGVSGHLDGLGQVTKRKVQNVDLVVSWLVMKHDVEVLVVFFVFLILSFWCSDNRTWTLLLLLFYQCLLFFLMGRDNLLDFVLELNDWRGNLGADSEKEVRDHEHHDQREDREGHNKELHNIVNNFGIHFLNFFTNEFFGQNQHKSILFGSI